MPRCDHIGPDASDQCSYDALAHGSTCLWHRATVRKDAPYVRAVFMAADEASAGRFAGAHLAGIDLHGELLPGRVFRGADLRDGRLDGCDLRGADLRGANLRRASLAHADLRGADLRGADLTGCRLMAADLREVDASEAILDGTLLLGADLRGANMERARIVSFQWNRLTRFQGILGLADPGEDEGETTRVFLSPTLLSDFDTGARATQQPSPELDATRTFAVRPDRGEESLPAAMASTPANTGALTPGSPSRGRDEAPEAPRAPTKLRWPGVVLSSLAGGLMVSVAWLAGLAWMGTGSDPHLLAQANQRIQGLEAQHGADLAQLTERDQRLKAINEKTAAMQAETAASVARAAQLEAKLQETLADVARLQRADDRAMLAQLDAVKAGQTTRALAQASARQDRVARILADGVARTTEENQQLTSHLAESQRRVQALEQIQALQIRQARELVLATQERDRLQGLYEAANRELTTARRDIERYLNRVAGTQLAGLLTDDHGKMPLLPITMGKAISLGGDYLVSLTVSPGTRNHDIQLKLLVQRPAAMANPDASIILYDRDQRPLRRLSASFPHVDDGSPFITLDSTFGCDREPAFARVILGPGDIPVASH
jgi:hypothetical protein